MPYPEPNFPRSDLYEAKAQSKQNFWSHKLQKLLVDRTAGELRLSVQFAGDAAPELFGAQPGSQPGSPEKVSKGAHGAGSQPRPRVESSTTQWMTSSKFKRDREPKGLKR